MRALNALRIGLLTHSVNPRGGVVHTLELARALHDAGHDVTVFAPARPGESMFRGSPCRVVLARIEGEPKGLIGMVAQRIRALKRALVGVGPGGFDVLHAQDSIGGNALAELKDECAIRGFVRTVHHLDHFDDPQLDRWQRRAWQDADAVFCVSDAWTHIMRSTYGVTAHTVPNGIDGTRYGVCADADTHALRDRFDVSGGPVVLAVGGIEERKNTSMLLEAFALLRARRPGAQLVLAGGASLLDHDDYTRRFLARAAALKLEVGARGTPVIVTGALPDAAMPALFRLADVVSMVSLREGFGLVVLEALASGRPVVVSRIAPFTEYLDDRTCIFADPHDASSIAAALEGSSGIDFVQAVPALLRRFTWQASAARHLDLYRVWLETDQPSNGATPCPSCTS